MEASAYAAVVSLIQILDNIKHTAWQRLHFDTNQIDTVREKASFLQDFLEDYSKHFSTDAQDLLRQIAAAANEAEDIIDSHVVDQLSQRFVDKADLGLSSFSEDMDMVIDKIVSIEKELTMVKYLERPIKVPEPGFSLSAAGSSAPALCGKSTMVGFDEHFGRLKDQLKGGNFGLQILPIVGMGGIGKTTLAKNIFDNSYIVNRFDIRIWVTISQEYSAKEILVGLLNGNGELGGQENRECSESLAELGLTLYQSLCGRRYLIVMDDMWSADVWDDFKSFFPENGNGSRIVVTTRLSDVGVFLGSHDPYLMDFLSEDESWKLFCEKAFAQEGCPLELEEIGKRVARNCRGLPLTIGALAGLLAKSNMKLEYWEKVAYEMDTFGNSEAYELCSNMLSLSYTHLPVHLKPCFLYMSFFHEDQVIPVSDLIKFWVAERFVKPIRGRSLEEVAEGYLKDLTDVNLILIHELGDRGEIKSIGIHDLLRDLCLKICEKEHFLHTRKIQLGDLKYHQDICLLCNRKSSTSVYLPQALVPQAIVPRALVTQLESPIWFFVCDICEIGVNRLRMASIDGGLQPTKLGYLVVSDRNELESTSLPLLWNLQTFINRRRCMGAYEIIDLPSEIWKMPQLRHIIILVARFHDPPVTGIGGEDSIILENLQTLKGLLDFRCTEEILKRIPNLKKLKILYYRRDGNFSYYQLHNLARLHKLESLSLMSVRFNLDEIAFPDSLKKLSLKKCRIPWKEMTIIGSLPNLEVLNLYHNAFDGPEWNPIEGEFLQLKFLFIGVNHLESWNAEKTHFPKLEKLRLRCLFRLKEIPSGIGEIDTLRLISLSHCSKSASKSAEEILEEQRSFGNDFVLLK